MNYEEASRIRGLARRKLREMGQNGLFSNKNKSAANVKTYMPIIRQEDDGLIVLKPSARYRLRQVVNLFNEEPCIYSIKVLPYNRGYASVIISVYHNA